MKIYGLFRSVADNPRFVLHFVGLEAAARRRNREADLHVHHCFIQHQRVQHFRSVPVTTSFTLLCYFTGSSLCAAAILIHLALDRFLTVWFPFMSNKAHDKFNYGSFVFIAIFTRFASIFPSFPSLIL